MPPDPGSPRPRPLAVAHATLALALLLGLALTRVGPLSDGDLFWNLRQGHYLLAARALPATDPFTWTAGDKPWVHHEWGAQVILAVVESAGGLHALRALSGVLTATTLLLVGLAWVRLSSSWALRLAALLLVWLTLVPHASVRPHLLGWTLCAAAYLMFLTRPPPWHLRDWLGFGSLLVVWMNIHSSAMIVFVLSFGFLCTQALEAWIRHQPMADRSHWFGVSALALASCFIQPSGPDLVRYVLETPGINRELSTEWWPLFRADVWRAQPSVLVAFCTVLGLVAVLGVRALRRGLAAAFPNVWVALAVLALAAQTRRMTFLAFVAVHFVLREGTAWWTGKARRDGRFLRFELRPKLSLAVCAALGLTTIAMFLPLEGALFARDPLRPGVFPRDAARFLKETNLSGRLFNPDGWGGFLEYELFPQYQVFVDGRWDLAGPALAAGFAMMARHGDYEALFDRYRIDVLIQPSSYYYRSAALDARGWLLAYRDDTAVVLLRQGAHLAANAERVRRFYALHPEAMSHAHWSVQLVAAGAVPTPTSVVPVLDRVSAAPSGK